ncbi:AAC(3) family N-acetyltransferase [Planococcus sp. N028]|uniref:Aminoglycoside N(3)-acetyltransferase n=1 Tax=Planococcus shixiaomingii TaxID=3058393 RepID=A0ABT8N2C9_9BACL|nr:MULTISPECIES: AAC(3) family N-acetyltransferase [unclassified Planococcus (in: firmicutes)]MDN7242046.1 AAC(3) family N-acetyltransferase [Planococcus sp. N028]WKA54322.1 AAC(3) family N-acetyltransferase [Planococcus sp. N022]
MTELFHILNTPEFQSKDSLKHQLSQLGITAGDALIVHSSLKAMGWIAGGSQAVVEALLETVTPEGTIVMPSQSADNSDPRYWMEPPIPENWHQPLRDTLPAYDPYLTGLRGMGKIAECFHRHPLTIRSAHPSHSFMAWGKKANEWMSEHPLEDSFGKKSPLGKMINDNVKIMLIGVGFDSCTALHLAEFMQEHQTTSPQGAAILVDGERAWQTYDCVDTDSDRFPELVKDFTGPILTGKLGQADVKITAMQPLVQFGAAWLKHHPAST